MFKRKRDWILLAVLLASSSLVFWWRQYTTSKRRALEAEARAANTKDFSTQYRDMIRWIGKLQHSFEIGVLTKSDDFPIGPLAPTQASALHKLDALVNEAEAQALEAAAVYMDTNPPDYREVNARVRSRIEKSGRHAERMVACGLLTEPQANLVMGLHLTRTSLFHVLRHQNVQDRLEWTRTQTEALDKVVKGMDRRQNALTGKKLGFAERGKQSDAIMADAEAEAMKILTPSQQATWSRLTGKQPVPEKAPDLPALSQAEAARIQLEKISPVFRVLTEKADAFDLSDTQEKLLHTLEEITRQGLYWISLRKDAPAAEVSRVRAEFVKQAEQLALVGILTHEQAIKVESAVK